MDLQHLKADMTQKPQELHAQPAVLRATIQVKRAATGKVEEYAVIGTLVAPPEAPPEPAKEN